MRFQRWSNLSWWRRSRLAALLSASLAVLAAIGLSAILTSGLELASLARLRPMALSVLPLLIVVLIAFHARLCDRINIRSGGSNTADAAGYWRESQ